MILDSYEQNELVQNIVQDIEMNAELEKKHHHKVSALNRAIKKEREAEEEAQLAQDMFV